MCGRATLAAFMEKPRPSTVGDGVEVDVATGITTGVDVLSAVTDVRVGGGGGAPIGVGIKVGGGGGVAAAAKPRPLPARSTGTKSRTDATTARTIPAERDDRFECVRWSRGSLQNVVRLPHARM